MARRTFFSFHYQKDIWRVNQIRSIPNVVGCAAAGFNDASLWEEARSKNDAAVKALIDEALKNTSVTVVFIGEETAGRKFINYEIEKSIERGNGIVGVQIHHLKDHEGKISSVGSTPQLLKDGGYPIYKYVDVEKLSNRIEEAATAAGK